MSREGVASGKSLLDGAQGALDLDLGPVVHRLLVPREVVGAREHRVAGLVRVRVGPRAFVRSGLVVPVDGGGGGGGGRVIVADAAAAAVAGG